jgi:alkylhydroperoxidase family enzyme
MTAFTYEGSPDPIRLDLAEAHRHTWEHIAAAGTWLTGAERVAVAEETRRARRCALCAERKAALSPFSIDGEHDQAGALSAPMVDAIHRVTTDPQRLTKKWLDATVAEGLPVEQYVEALGVAVLVISIDEFHHALSLAQEALPEPVGGEPSRYRPRGAVLREAWVPMIDLKQADPAEKKLLAGPGGRSAGVILALSLVPDQVQAWSDLSDAQYLSREHMVGMETGRAIDRSQVELVAGRVSALNECFY